MILFVHLAKRLQLLAYGLIDRPARSVVGGDDDGVVGLLRVVPGNRCDAFLRIGNLRDPSLLLQERDALGHLAAR